MSQIQNVFELADGSALFVTVARYKTPALVDIDKVLDATRCVPLQSPRKCVSIITVARRETPALVDTGKVWHKVLPPESLHACRNGCFCSSSIFRGT